MTPREKTGHFIAAAWIGGTIGFFSGWTALRADGFAVWLSTMLIGVMAGLSYAGLIAATLPRFAEGRDQGEADRLYSAMGIWAFFALFPAILLAYFGGHAFAETLGQSIFKTAMILLTALILTLPYLAALLCGALSRRFPRVTIGSHSIGGALGVILAIISLIMGIAGLF